MKFFLSVILMIVAISAAMVALFALGFIVYGNWIYWDGDMGQEASGFMWLFWSVLLMGSALAVVFYRLSCRVQALR